MPDFGNVLTLRIAIFLCLPIVALRAQDARQIVEESQRRGRTASDRYRGNLQVTAAPFSASHPRPM